MDFLKRYDASNGRTIEGVATKSAVGAALTVISCALVLILIMTELSVYWSTATVHHMMVDPQVEELDTVRISLHATFFHLGCEDVQLDLEATRGDTAFGLEENAVAKVPAGEGCSLKGDLVVAKVGGNFHIATGKLSGGSPVIQLMGGMFLGGGGGAFKGANLSHTIHHLSFGEDFPGITSPLEEVTNIIPMDVGQYQFHIKVVPSTYKPLKGPVVYSNSYSISEQFLRLGIMQTMSGASAPGIYFNYDFFPIAVEYHETKPSFLQFLTRVCGIVGGVMTVAGVLDGLLHRAGESMKKAD